MEVEMTKVVRCLDSYKLSLQHINEVKEQVWNHI